MLLVAGSSAIDVLLACSYGGRVAWWLSRDLWVRCCQSWALGMAGSSPVVIAVVIKLSAVGVGNGCSCVMMVWSWACRLLAVVEDGAHGHGLLFACASTCWRERSQSRRRVDRCPVVPVMRGHGIGMTVMIARG
jgi:hypothetical protein